VIFHSRVNCFNFRLETRVLPCAATLALSAWFTVFHLHGAVVDTAVDDNS
jgi:hypothetical protein